MDNDKKTEFIALYEKLSERAQACILIAVAQFISESVELSPEMQAEIEQVTRFLDRGGDD